MKAELQKQNKKRHGCLSIWLAMMVIGNIFTVVTFLFLGTDVTKMFSQGSNLIVGILTLLTILNVICIFGLYKWKRWGFYGFVFNGSVAFLINLYMGMGLLVSLFGMLGVVILFATLHIGKENKAWPQLD